MNKKTKAPKFDYIVAWTQICEGCVPSLGMFKEKYKTPKSAWKAVDECILEDAQNEIDAGGHDGMTAQQVVDEEWTVTKVHGLVIVEHGDGDRDIYSVNGFER